MASLAPCFLAGIAFMLVVEHFGALTGVHSSSFVLAASESDPVARIGAPALAKGNRLASPDLGHARMAKIVPVEIIGLHDAAILYRDREGRILFRNDPLTNTTIIAKNVELPQVIMRDQENVRRRPTGVPPEPGRPKLPVGCDPVFGALVDHPLRGLTGHCLTEIPGSSRVAALR